MDQDHNRRLSDSELAKLIARVDRIEQELDLLRKDVESQTDVNLRAHATLLAGIQEIRQELIMHTRAEEAKFDTIIRNQAAHFAALEKLTTDTAPAVSLTNTGKYLSMAIKFVKDTIVPLVAGVVLAYGALSSNVHVSMSPPTVGQPQSR